MAYTREFIDKVKALYPNTPEMHRLAEEGNQALGRWLDDSSCGGISPDKILKSTYEEMLTEAQVLKARRKLYGEFVSGKCYTTESLYQVQCPALYMQNNDDPNRYELEKQICTGVGYVGYFPGCKKWNCKEQCWAKYNELKKEI